MAEVVVIGAGVAGIQAALDLAGHDIHVHLIEREPTIGGHMAQLDKTFPTNDCSMCILSPKMVEVARHPKITIHTCAEVESVEGEVGRFHVRVRKHPRYIVEDECNGCGDCTRICPVEVYNRFDAGIGVRKAIYKPHAQAVPDVVVKDKEHCIECGLCYDVCGREAILREDEERLIEIEAASIVVTTGYATFDARNKTQLRYLTIPDVITSLEFERMINASGPTGGKLKRLSNGKPPQSVAFVQCVGSRDIAAGRPYCSGVCCMYAMKNAVLIREKNPGIEVTVFYNDVRAYGKGYEEYYERARNLGVRFVRGFPGEVLAANDHLMMTAENTETGEVETFHPDLVVLSVGLEPAGGAEVIARMLGIPQDESGFFGVADQKVGPVLTVKPGIYVAGTATAPRDIPDSVAMGGAAAMRAYLDVIRAG
ncbi:CoB--CoM heterodisulfide reductase iron-sulfur subunit A family protein [Methanoculleus sp. Wushi-C6]|uniref:CoB--CoM heterodisulfide reductase iron-sulfur subunit A n=1 Tax=Methanoculleus caldifontis TaxID=2651577 RepID=A0ABU3X490_9EURY|nr:CoB--CoM heterodisulfide reductase iron-sulfur subunit A family protein [Methanoculleus sp. Wushi-C6]MDV2482844.1 CoB--CoM heterodisulfide reductase iron-sulfur subunit A family protein [Methanoculleus sp. Wushi-C6]